jgi:TolB-like protein/Flp pilus assembly protein TadD
MQPPGHAQGTIRFGVFEVDVKSGELRKQGLKTRLPPQPFQVLLALLEHPGEVVTRRDLRQKLWPDDTFVDFEMGLSSAMKKLRDALEDSARNPRFVETLPRRGYRFIAPLEALTRREPDDGPAAAPGQIKSIAVLPLENLSGDPSQDYFVDGMTDALITQLAQIGSLRVISRTSVMRYKDARKPLATVARELNVDAVVEGAVVRSGQRVRISAQLVHAPTEHHLWARSYQRDMSDILALQEEVARAIAEEIQVNLTPPERARMGRPRQANPDAYDTCLKARYYLNKQTFEGYSKALEYFEQAIAEDPTSALAYAGLSASYALLTFMGPLSPQESMPKAEAAARKALELDEALADAHTALATIAYRFRYDWSESDREFRRALELSPNDAECHRLYSVFLWSAGRGEEGFAEARRARELDPLEPGMTEGWIFFWARQYDRAIAEFRRVLEKDPDFVHGHLGLGSAYTLRGNLRDGIRALESAATLSRRNPTHLARLGHAYAVAGKEHEASKILEELHACSRHRYVSPVGIALVHVGLGDKEKALAWLEKAYRVRDFDLVTRNPRLDPLRTEPRFQALMRRVGLG